MIQRMQKKDLYGIFREPVTDEMVPGAPCLCTPSAAAHLTRRRAALGCSDVLSRTLHPPFSAPWGLSEEDARCALLQARHAHANRCTHMTATGHALQLFRRLAPPEARRAPGLAQQPRQQRRACAQAPG